MKSSSDDRSKIPCSVCKNYKCKTDAHLATNALADTLAEEKPSKKSKKGGAKGSVALLRRSIQLGCVSQDSYPRKSSPCE